MGNGRADVDDLCELDRLAVVERLQLRQLVGVVPHQIGEAIDQAGAVGGRGLGPGSLLERAAGRPDSAIDVCRPSLSEGRDRTRGRGIHGLEPASIRGRGVLAIDQQLVLAGGERACGLGQLLGQGRCGHALAAS
jgi:hypothetical protein